MRRTVGTMLTGMCATLAIAIALAPALALAQVSPGVGNGPLPSPGGPPPGAPPQAPTPVAPPQDPLANQKLDQILARWEQESGQTVSLYAEFEKIEKLVLVGTEKRYQGKAYLQRPNLAVLNLDKQQGEQFEFDQRIVCTGREVVEYSAAATQVTVYPLPKDSQQKELEEGPLPFLFGMKAEDIKRRYKMTLKTESEKSYRIEIEPLLAIDRDAFAVAMLDLNKETLLPDALHMLSANGQDQQHFYFSKITKNQRFQENTFLWSAELAQNLRQQGWSIVVNPPPDDVEFQMQPAPGQGQAPSPSPAVGRTPAQNGVPR